MVICICRRTNGGAVTNVRCTESNGFKGSSGNTNSTF